MDPLPKYFAGEFSGRFSRAKKAKVNASRARQPKNAWSFPKLPDNLRHGSEPYLTGATARRDHRLPPLYLSKSHPRRPKILQGKGHDFIYAWDSQDAEFIDNFRAFVKNELAIPKGPNRSMDSHGMRSETSLSPSSNIFQGFTAFVGEIWSGLATSLRRARLLNATSYRDGFLSSACSLFFPKISNKY